MNGTFHLPPHENICTIALINIHYLYNNLVIVICFFPNVVGSVKPIAAAPTPAASPAQTSSPVITGARTEERVRYACWYFVLKYFKNSKFARIFLPILSNTNVLLWQKCAVGPKSKF